MITLTAASLSSGIAPLDPAVHSLSETIRSFGAKMDAPVKPGHDTERLSWIPALAFPKSNHLRRAVGKRRRHLLDHAGHGINRADDAPHDHPLDAAVIALLIDIKNETEA